FDPIPKTPENSDDEGNGEEDLGLNVGMESIFETTSQMDAQTPTSVAPLPMAAPTMTPSTIATITTTSQAPILPTTAPSTIIQNLPNFGSVFGFRMNEAVEFLKTVDENMQKIIKEQVKEQVQTSYVVAADLSEMELKKILIEKMEGNKSIQRSDEQKNLYKAPIEAYESDKIILDTYEETVTLKRRRDDDADKDEEPSAGPDRGSKRRREGKEPESASAPKEKATRSAGKSTQGDVGVEIIFTMTSSLIVSLKPPTPIMTPSTIATITTSGEAPIPPPTIPSIILENLPTFNSSFRFEERLRLLETSFSEYRQTNQFADAVSAIPGIVHQYMDQQMKEAVRETVQIQTDWLQDSLQRDNDEFLRNIDENIKKVLKGLVKN
nr:hypothetical protein [Tanacetum cinerariifolium]